LLVRSFLELQKVDLGLRPENLLTVRATLSALKYPDLKQTVPVVRQILKRIEAIPEVESVGGSSMLPLIGSYGRRVRITLGNSAGTPSAMMRGEWQAWPRFMLVTANYLQTLGTPLRAGRYFTEQDRL